MRLVQHDIARLILRHQPAPVVLARKLGWVLRQQARRHHVAVERALRLLLCEAGLLCLTHELRFDLLAHGIACSSQ